MQVAAVRVVRGRPGSARWRVARAIARAPTTRAGSRSCRPGRAATPCSSTTCRCLIGTWAWPGRQSQSMSWRAQRSWIMRMPSSDQSNSLRESSMPICEAILDWSQPKPKIAWPPLRPEAPQPTRWLSSTITAQAGLGQFDRRGQSGQCRRRGCTHPRVSAPRGGAAPGTARPSPHKANPRAVWARSWRQTWRRYQSYSSVVTSV